MLDSSLAVGKIKNKVWSIAGFDPSGGAGILADQHVCQTFKVAFHAIVTALTAQNGNDFLTIAPVSAELLQAQLTSLKMMGWPAVIKISLIPNLEMAATIFEFLKPYSGIIIYDPVMRTSTGHALSNITISELKPWLSQITILTPNIAEAAFLTGRQIINQATMRAAASDLLAQGVKHIIIKGGHLISKDATDLWLQETQAIWLKLTRRSCGLTHGGGCVFSSTLSAYLASEHDIGEAIIKSKMVIDKAFLTSPQMNKVKHIKIADTQLSQMRLPILSFDNLQNLPSFSPCIRRLGFYPIIDSLEWLEKLLTWKVTAIQLRLKNTNNTQNKLIIKEAINLTKGLPIQLFINDHWRIALEEGAYGVHLGQEDLQECNWHALLAAGVRLGISTHNLYELAYALSYAPSYIALGPIYRTHTKAMRFKPQGLINLKAWRKWVDCQLVAIGGINLVNLQGVLNCKVDGVAVISALTRAKNPTLASQVWRERCH